MTRIFLGNFVSGFDRVAIGEDAVAAAFKAANAELDAEARRRQAAIADAERLQNTRRAKAARRLKKALTLWRR